MIEAARLMMMAAYSSMLIDTKILSPFFLRNGFFFKETDRAACNVGWPFDYPPEVKVEQETTSSREASILRFFIVGFEFD